jgi:hypothetical protein
MNNDEAREYAKNRGVTNKSLTDQSVDLLHAILSRKLIESGCFSDSFRMSPIFKKDKPKNNEGRFSWVSLRCNAHYFQKREAVSFNRDGFIGFCGWASSGNATPIISGFIEWVDAAYPKQN